MNESEFWTQISKQITGHKTRIESGTTNGIPDVNVVLAGIEFWIELKVADPNVLLRKEQYAWGMAHARKGGRVFVLAITKKVWGMVHLWKFPDVEIDLQGEFLRVINPPHDCSPSDAEFLMTTL